MEGSQKKFTALLSKFKIFEFPDVFKFVFKDLIRWDDVKRKLKYCKLSEIASNVAKVGCSMYQETRPSKEEAAEKIYLLMLCDVSFHYNHRWYGLKLESPFPDGPSSSTQLEKLIVRAYKQELRDCVVFSITRRHCLWLMVIEMKTTKGKVKYGQPVYFAYNISLKIPYAFFTPKLSDTYPLVHFGTAFGFQDVRQLSTSGQDVSNLYLSIERKRNTTVATRNHFPSASPVVDGCIIDYTQSRHYAEFGKDLLTGDSKIKTLTVECEPSSDQSMTSKRSALTIKCLKDNKIEDVLQQMLACQAIRMPIPEWVQSFEDMPRNLISLQNDFSLCGDGES